LFAVSSAARASPGEQNHLRTYEDADLLTGGKRVQPYDHRTLSKCGSAL